jgi:hypothetical protein
VRTIIDKRIKLRYVLLKDIADLADDGKLLLALGERVPEAGVGVDDRLQVPEHLRDKVVPFLRRGDDIGLSETLDPDLAHRPKKTSKSPSNGIKPAWNPKNAPPSDTPYPHEVPLSINNLINRLLALLLRLAERVRNLLGDRVDPQCASIGSAPRHQDSPARFGA